ncbi:MAG TPA: tripartite tricarboxylate transporter TctB family protein [Candidatus Avidesulfovibrio excrementigallinarum]|nr:tripartite tricarboxylate transporter TctB family protein [Candidatus Avidesulfovibrio excrementigallinarum]
MSYKYQEVVFSLLMLGVGVFLLAHTFSDQYQTLLSGDGVLSPMFYPRVILAGWCVLSVAMTVQALKLPATLVKAFNVRQVVCALLLMVAMLILLACFGFLVAAIPFVFGFALFLGYKNKLVAAIAAVIIPVLLYVLFDKGLGIILPAGVWHF